MKSLFLAWQAPTDSAKSRAWFPVGQLDAEPDVPHYRFRYTQGALKAERDVGFAPLLAFPDFKKAYEFGDKAIERVSRLKVGEELRILVELNNPATRLAVPLLTNDYQMIGWAPRYLVDDLINCVPFAPELSARIARINTDAAPLNQRILVDYTGRAPQGTQPMSTPDFKPLMD